MRTPITVIATLLALVLASCANAPAATPTASPPASTPAPTTGGGDPSPAPDGPYEHLARAEAGEFAGTTVTILGQWIEAEGQTFADSLAGFAERTGIEVAYEGITNYETVLNVRAEGRDTPDLAQIAQPGLMQSFQRDGHLVNLSEFFNTEQLQTDTPAFYDLGTVDGDLYGVYYKADLKSIVWYPVQAFADNGYEVPETWDELIALSDQIVADGNGNPWCISIEHGDASGWVATDWIEDVLLRTAPLETYDQWVTGDIPFNHPDVLRAAEYVSQIWFTEGYVFGGNTAINATWVGDTQTPMFDEAGPRCWMHKQAAWIPAFWPADESTDPPTPLFEPGVDSSFFYLPPIDPEFGRPLLGGGDMFVMFNDRPEVRAVIEYLATAEAAEHWIEVGGFVSPNVTVPTEWYTTYPSSGLAEIIDTATALRFDASDIMPASVGQGTFWDGMVDWVAANGDNTEQIFERIHQSWP
jgi:alpha-glucoside transport system substrate-binding protein